MVEAKTTEYNRQFTSIDAFEKSGSKARRVTDAGVETMH